MMKGMIVGSTKVGKTALFASLQQAVNHSSFSAMPLSVLAKNEATRQIFSHALDIIKTGESPFAGTHSSASYEFILSAEEKQTLFQKLLFWTSPPQQYSHFLDGPGGAFFSRQTSHQTSTVFREMIQHIQESSYLLICIDLSKFHNVSYREKEQLQQFYVQSFQFFLTHAFQLTLPIKRVSFVLTKADLYARNKGQIMNAQSFIEKLDPIRIVCEMLGRKSLQTLLTFLNRRTRFSFDIVSVYGFHQGNLHYHLGNEFRTAKTISPDHWIPYQILNPFRFLLLQHPVQNQWILSFQELQNRVK